MSNDTKMTYANSAPETLTLEQVSHYIDLFEPLYNLHRELGLRAVICGDFLEKFSRMALNLRKPEVGDAIDSNDNLIEIKSTRFGSSLGKTDLSVFGWKEVLEDSFNNLILTVWDPEIHQIQIYSTGVNSAEFRNIQATKLKKVSDNCRLKQNSLIHIMESIVRPRKIEPIRIYDTIARQFIK